MKHFTLRPAQTLFVALALALAAGTTANAQSASQAVEQRLKASLNTMVHEVHEAETPAAKRALLDRFFDQAGERARLMGRIPFLSGENRTALNMLEKKFGGYSANLHGGPGTGASSEGAAGVADPDLNAYASFVQQDLEQAASGGIYLSTGAIIIVLLILLILT
jgi:hypothetical protein